MNNFDFIITQEKIPNINKILTVEERIEKMKDYFPPFLVECDLIKDIIDAQAKEIVEVHNLNYELFLQLYPQTCTWSIDLWEDMCGIPVNKSLNIETRRSRLLAKLTQIETVTPDSLRRTISNFTEHFILTIKNESYYFEVLVDSLRSQNDITHSLKSAIEYCKPAHLNWQLIYSYYFKDEELGNLVTYDNKLYLNQDFKLGNNPREYDDNFNILDGESLTFNGLRAFDGNELFVGRTGLNKFLKFDGESTFDGGHLFSGKSDNIRHTHKFNLFDVCIRSNSEYVMPSQDNNIEQDNILLNDMTLMQKSYFNDLIHDIRITEIISSTFDGSTKFDGNYKFDGYKEK